jgi:hypothetical protein
MQNIPYRLTPAELPAREQSHEQHSDFAAVINIFCAVGSAFLKFFFTALWVCSPAEPPLKNATPNRLIHRRSAPPPVTPDVAEIDTRRLSVNTKVPI